MRVVHYLREVRLEYGGVTRAVLDMASLLSAQGVDVTLLSVDDHDVPERWRDSAGGGVGIGEGSRGVVAGLPRAIRLGRPRGAFGRFTRDQLGEIRGLIEGADVVHLHTMWEPTNPQIGDLSRSLGVPYAVSVHGMLDEWSMRQSRLKKLVYLRLFGSSMLCRAGGVHCVSPAEFEQGSRWFPRGLGRVIPLLFDLEPFSVGGGAERVRGQFDLGAEVGKGGGRPLLLFMSRIHYVKGLDRLLGAMRILQLEGIRPVLVVAGTGTEESESEAKRLAGALPNPEDVRFVGFVGGDLKIGLLQLADLFVHPTSQENFGFSVFEALAAGTPVLTTQGVGMWRELEESGGALIRDREPADVAGGVRELLEGGRDRLREMGDRGRGWVHREFAPDALAGRYIDFYKGLCRGRGSVR